MRKEYEITDEQVQIVKAANNPLDLDVLACVADGYSMEEVIAVRVDQAWTTIGNELGFIGFSAQPVDGHFEDLNHCTALEKVCDENRH